MERFPGPSDSQALPTVRMNFRRIFDILHYQQAKYPQKAALCQRRERGWVHYSTEECLGIIDRLSCGLLRLGLTRGDRTAMMVSAGSPLWYFFDFALQQTGIVVVPLHDTLMAQDVAYILKDARVRLCIVSGEAQYRKVLQAQAGMPGLQHIFSFEEMDGVPHWETLLAQPPAQESATLASLKSSIAETDLATLLYTSGSTGRPKGVMLTHANIVSNIKSLLTLVPVNHRKQALSFLPLSHIFERVVGYLYMAAGTSVWFARSMDHFPADVLEVRPHFFTAVPRVLEKMQERVIESRQGKGFWGKKMLGWALACGQNFDPLEKLSPVFWLRHQFLDLFVYRHWRRMLGGRVEGIVVGAAALQPRLARLLCAAGIPAREGYGLTETSPVVAFNRFEPGLYRFGAVGIPIPGVEVKIDRPNENGEGEILVRGPNVMTGYFNQPEETAAALDPDGWLRTGDVGKFVNRRFLKITGRKRDFFKTTSGKFVAPLKVENQLQSSHFIKQSMVLGLNQPYVAALIVPNFDALETWCSENNVHWTAPQFMALNPKVRKFMENQIEELNQPLEPHERVRRFTLLHEEWTAENGTLTLTMKLMRDVLEKKFEKEIGELF
jgi:long-chain acyl-CoA synthetase